jgi:hypothetical protein
LLPWGRRWSSASWCWVVVAAAGCWLSCAILCLLLDWWFSRGDTNFHSTSTVIRIRSQLPEAGSLPEKEIGTRERRKPFSELPMIFLQLPDSGNAGNCCCCY